MGLGFVDLIAKTEIRLKAILPTAYRKIYEIFNMQLETKPVLDRGYAIYFGPVEEYNGATGHFTSQGTLIVALTHYAKIKGDNQSLIDVLYADIETVIRSFRDGSKLNCSSLITLGSYSISQPRLINGEEHLVVEISFNCLFREVK